MFSGNSPPRRNRMGRSSLSMATVEIWRSVAQNETLTQIMWYGNRGIIHPSEFVAARRERSNKKLIFKMFFDSNILNGGQLAAYEDKIVYRAMPIPAALRAS